MNFPKTVSDTYDDAVVVEPGYGNVYLHNRDVPEAAHNLDLKVDFSFSPEAARRLARALKKAADAAEEDFQ